ncbi:MAG: FAD-dependent oxidoreductase [Opitutaceae bacterium]|nr:FAD-dependent oxidoreductase [Opitutaceae bacterium]
MTSVRPPLPPPADLARTTAGTPPRRRGLRPAALALALALATAAPAEEFDIVVIGGTPGGVAAAVTAARLGHRTALVEYHPHLGGMAASGLGKSDIEHREAIGGLWREFVGRVHDHYVRTYGPDHENVKLARDGYYYEPSVAERVFDALVAEPPELRVYRHHRLEGATRAGAQVTAVTVLDRATGELRELRGRAFIDATYEGDLAAAAGAAYRLGREARAEFNELHAGVVYMDYETRTFVAGTTGEGDRRIPAYTYRLCLTQDPANSLVLTAPPAGYDRERYVGYLDDWQAGRFAPPRQMKDGVGYYAPTFGTVVRALSMADLPNRKLDVNMNPRPLGFPFAEENYDYPEADWDRREQIAARLRDLTLGLLWFLQNDPAIPAEHRALARRFHLAKDEFVAHGHFPWQLYVREARRIVGEYTLSEQDLILGPELGRTRLHRDSIAAGEYPIDSFPVRRREPGHDVALEGYILMLDRYTFPYQIPYRIMVPRDVEGLLVPVAASTTHVAFSSIRLEPTWMALGQAAATAAHLALRDGTPLRRVGAEPLQRALLRQGQVLTFFRDIDPAAPEHAAIQFYGTKGFFPDYLARAAAPVTRAEAARWLGLALGEPGTRLGAALDADDTLLTAADLAGLARAAGWPGPPDRSSGPVSRGQFCRWLFEATAPTP